MAIQLVVATVCSTVKPGHNGRGVRTCENKGLRGQNATRAANTTCYCTAQGLCGVGVVVMRSVRLLQVVQGVWNREHGPGEHADNSGNHAAVRVDPKGERSRQGTTTEYTRVSTSVRMPPGARNAIECHTIAAPIHRGEVGSLRMFDAEKIQETYQKYGN